MARVFDAFDERLERPAAVKVLRTETRALPGMRQRFQQEALIAARLLHPHIVAVLDFGEDHASSYLVMERLPGTTLRDEIIARGPLSPAARPPRAGRDARRAGGRPRPRGAAPRHQAQQHSAAAGRAHEDHRFRHRQELRHPDRSGSAGRRHDDDGGRAGDTGLPLSRAEIGQSGDRPVRPVRGRCGHGRGIDGTTPRSRAGPAGAAAALAAPRGASRHGHGPTGPLHVGERNVAVPANRSRRFRCRVTAPVCTTHGRHHRPGTPAARRPGARHRSPHRAASTGSQLPGSPAATSSSRPSSCWPSLSPSSQSCGTTPARQGRLRPRQGTTCTPRR